ncbi:MAG: YIP1 family protein [Candidatus Bathyarchaeota archaeon]|nr:YIP1 family protein [Candidatus Bathyarchaeota archaeon]
MSDEKPGFIGQVTGVLYKPRQIFSTVDEGDRTKGLIVMFVMVLLAAYSSMLYLGKIPLSVLSPQLEGVDTSQIEGSMGLFAGIGAGISILVGWSASTLLMHGLGKLSGGNGSMKRMFALHGFASVPSLLNQLIRVVDASIMDSASLASYFVSYRSLGKILTAFIGANLMNLWGIATIALLVLAVEENYELSRTRSVMVVLLPSVVYFLINYFTG